ncbi:acyl-CoA/acyl-ACP dehydrogenase [Patulibacter sp. SYSU D01012]|uniref:acyl-CoA/acyl-ACP dehydrogenase n=1 Tax=Patulibacter sp. SYSU D01012 TaxID=2817381 RepID=UPI001B3087FF|nr:acyl-CoA/acyl-ACP dehydrogenase [Patulibacter sp. SYSU D01012]
MSVATHVPSGATTATPADWPALVAAGWTAADAFDGRAAELSGVRAVAAADLGLGRILDGHRNALERLLVHRPEDVAPALRARVAAGEVPLGVWGADPRGDEGPPALLARDGRGRPVARGVKTFCSGAGVVALALVLLRDTPDGRPAIAALVDVSDPATAEVDRSWFAAPALRTSESHRVVLRDAPVLAVLGAPGALLEDPFFSGDALRTAASWAGALDAVVAGTRAALRPRGATDAEALLLGRVAAAHATVDRWLEHACAAVDAGAPHLADTVLHARLEITERAREILRLTAELTGSHAIATDDRAARARRDLDLLLLQHRLTPAAVRLGHRTIGAA